jgi:magnesium transporter
VVDKEDRLVGIITFDDAFDVLQEENTEDFERMAGMTPSENTYLKTSVWDLSKNRILWLMILMVSAMITGSLLESYESAISALPLLVSFIPMLMGTGGNSGSQATTMIIRGLALDEIELRDVFRVWWKEIRVAVTVGIALSIVNFIRIVIQYRSDPNCIPIAATVSLTLIATVLIAKSLGCLLPMMSKKLHLDPAVVAAPMLTTITDACSILVFFNIAIGLLGRLM